MAFVTGLGYMPYALQRMAKAVGDGTAPNLKIDHVGLFKCLNNQTKHLNLNRGGSLQQMQIKYKKRWTIEQTSTTDNCTNTLNQGYEEAAVNLSNARYISITLDDRIVQQYEEEASKFLKGGGIADLAIMEEMEQEIMNAASGLLTAVNNDLWGLLVPNLGVNRRSGHTIDTINMNQNIQNLPLNDGFPQIWDDLMENLFSNTTKPKFIGSGLFNNFMGAAPNISTGFNGLNNPGFGNQLDWYFDQQAGSLLGPNQVIAMDDGAVQLVEFMRFVGPYAGVKPGNSIFGTIALPIKTVDYFGTPTIKEVWFDWQCLYSPCPTEFTDTYYGTPININRGYTLILSKQFGLFTLPGDSYFGMDPMALNKGTLRYTITNI